VLRSLLNDSDVLGHAIIALGKLKAEEAKADIEPLLLNPRAWIRREAKKALERIARRN